MFMEYIENSISKSHKYFYNFIARFVTINRKYVERPDGIGLTLSNVLENNTQM